LRLVVLRTPEITRRFCEGDQRIHQGEKSKAIVNNYQEKAKTEIDFSRANEGTEAVMLEFEQLSNCNAGLHQSCDFVMKNSRIRQNVCDGEITLAMRRLRPGFSPRA